MQPSGMSQSLATLRGLLSARVEHQPAAAFPQARVRLDTYHKNVDDVIGYYKKVLFEVRAQDIPGSNMHCGEGCL